VSTKTQATAVVLVPPLEDWPAIQAIRQQHDRNARRWMPHITLLYPFAPRHDFPALAPILQSACADVQPFAITLARFGVFGHGRRGATLFLAPEPAEPLIALQTQLWQALPAYDDTRRHRHGFTPHLSVGQARSEAEARTLGDTLATDWQPVTFTAAAVQLIWRGEVPDDIFRVAHTLALGSQGP
jgi:RNA 2',3'-cyclic 3'-phosphodiesterase